MITQKERLHRVLKGEKADLFNDISGGQNGGKIRF